jgi:hypothetical protein
MHAESYSALRCKHGHDNCHAFHLRTACCSLIPDEQAWPCCWYCLLLLLLLTSLRSKLIRRGLLLDMLAGVARNESSSMASKLHVAVGEADGGASTATGEEGPILALAEIRVCTALSGRLLSQDELTTTC